MKIERAGFQIIPRSEEAGCMDVIELAGRACYRSEDKIAPGSAEAFVRQLIERGHEAMLEHGDYIFRVSDRQVYENIALSLQGKRDRTGCAPDIKMTAIDGRYIVSGNIREWRKLIMGTSAGAYFDRHIDKAYLPDINMLSVCLDPHVRQIHYDDLVFEAERLTHERMTVRFTVDRGILAEFTRHRTFAFAAESTRFCNYAKGKFGSEITVIEPCYLIPGTSGFTLWKRQCMGAEVAYFHLMNFGCGPQEARAVLPMSLKTTLFMTGGLAAWKHFFWLRALEKTGRVHPQAKEVAGQLLAVCAGIYPSLFGGEAFES